MQFKRSGPLYVPDRTVRRYSSDDLARYKRYRDRFRPKAAIAFDGSSNSAVGSSVSTRTFSHTVTSNTNGILIVAAHWWNPTHTVTDITYAGAALTQVPSARAESASDAFGVDLWYKLTPATGANNVIITMDSSCTALAGGASSWTGVDQGTPLGTAVTNTGSNGLTDPINVTVSSASGEIVVDAASTYQGIAVDVSQTQLYNPTPATLAAGGSYKAGAATVLMQWTEVGGAYFWAQSGVSLKVASAGGRTTKNTRTSPLGIEIGMGWRMDL